MITQKNTFIGLYQMVEFSFYDGSIFGFSAILFNAMLSCVSTMIIKYIMDTPLLRRGLVGFPTMRLWSASHDCNETQPFSGGLISFQTIWGLLMSKGLCVLSTMIRIETLFLGAVKGWVKSPVSVNYDCDGKDTSYWRLC